MTGKELIEWIQEHKAEDMDCVVQYRDSGGSYYGGELVEPPQFATYKRDPDGHPYDVDISYRMGLLPNCIVF